MQLNAICHGAFAQSSPTDIITIRARSADLTAELRNRRERGWDSTTLGAILTTLAGEHGLTQPFHPR
ncbi:hypothetical protein [Lysobacter auxotrophicus]|uniref:Uncharacterized protein n=1 Tax=Lysobacter auxotrophicus TaxID=2992573 RepID=A0ABN6UL98_9GAMM|nr:hypothetical protein [Lysobacter auxotrophicus]BDU16920.1 hypothetical protein LA521A_21210 [Lysobacter auxotrophicus]